MPTNGSERSDGASIQRDLAAGTLAPDAAIPLLAAAGHDARSVPLRAAAARALGDIAGRAYGASWEVAERAAFALLETARDAEAPAERVAVLGAVGRGFRNAWLVPYVHACLFDADAAVVRAAIGAAGGLAFPALEETLAAFLDLAPERAADAAVRASAIAALGRMGAESAVPRLVPLVVEGSPEAAPALGALAEIRSAAAREPARALLDGDPPPALRVALLRYLAEIGDPEVERALGASARDDDDDVRRAADLARRALEAERRLDAGERILAALTETDRAVRARLARRLRTLPVAEVLAQAEVLVGDDPSGVIQVVAEVRAPEVTRLLLRLAEDGDLDVAVRARAAGSIEANEPWERDALVALVEREDTPAIRAAAAQTLGAFAPTSFVLDRLAPLAADPAAAVRAALLWAIQLSARPRSLGAGDRRRAEEHVRRALDDADASVRRRAAYVAGNLDAAELVGDLLALARREEQRRDLRVAAFVALGEVGAPARVADLVHLWNREDDPEVLGALGRALERSLALGPAEEGDAPRSLSPASLRSSALSAPPSAPPPSLARAAGRLPKLVASADPRIRAAAARVAGLARGDATVALVTPLLADPSPRVRERAVVAIGRAAATAEVEALLVAALDDADASVQERAAEALIAHGGARAFERVVDLVARASDRGAAARLAAALAARPGKLDAARRRAVAGAVGRLPPDDDAYEILAELEVAALAATATATATGEAVPVDDAIAAAFPAWPRLSAGNGFAALAKSLRTAELLFAASARGGDGDHSAPIVLWAKGLEGYLHARLAPRMRALRERGAAIWELCDHLAKTAWPAYQRWLAERWPDPVVVGRMEVEVPLRAAVNALRDLDDRRKGDGPSSVTEWSRIVLFFGVDHPSGPRNVLGLAAREPERTARLAHRLQVLAQVRNAVAHRATADAETLAEFRRLYYAAFEELVALA